MPLNEGFVFVIDEKRRDRTIELIQFLIVDCQVCLVVIVVCRIGTAEQSRDRSRYLFRFPYAEPDVGIVIAWSLCRLADKVFTHSVFWKIALHPAVKFA